MVMYIWWSVAALSVARAALGGEIVRTHNDVNASSGFGVYELSDSYNFTNFFGKFTFFEVRARLCYS